MTRSPLIHANTLQAAWEAFLAVRAAGADDHEALTKAIEAADARRAQAVHEAIRKKLKAAAA
jgi:hypothetical protein